MTPLLLLLLPRPPKQQQQQQQPLPLLLNQWKTRRWGAGVQLAKVWAGVACARRGGRAV
jgi:hypothetical protein